jgi:hypothetical protein
VSRPRQLGWRIAVCESDLDLTAKYIAFALDTFMDAEGFAYPSRATLARRARVAVRTVDRAIGRLEVTGFLVVLRSRGRKANRYQSMFPNGVTPDAVAQINSVRRDAAEASAESPLTASMVTPELASRTSQPKPPRAMAKAQAVENIDGQEPVDGAGSGGNEPSAEHPFAVAARRYVVDAMRGIGRPM